MRSSTAEREKLLSGYSLLLIAVLFALAFYLLLPSEQQFKFGQSTDTVVQSQKPVDDLELAYLRARVATGEHTKSEVSDAVLKLIDAGRFDKAQTLLAEHPNVQLTDADRIRLELEQATFAYQQSVAGSEPRNSKSVDSKRSIAELESSIVTALHRMMETPTLQTVENLKRGAEISALLKQEVLSSSLYRSLALVDQTNSAHWFEQCGTYAMAANEKQRASECYQRATESTDNPTKLFSLKLMTLRELYSNKSAADQQSLIDELLAHNPVSAAQLEELSIALLAVERPDIAVDTYSRLAEIDKVNQAQWLSSAAKWAVASSQNKRATELLSEMRPLVSEDEAKNLDQEIENLLIADGEQSAVLDRAKSRIAANPYDYESLRVGVTLAQQLGDTKQALDWNTRLLSFEPLNDTVLRRQTTLLLAMGDLDGAKLVAERTVQNNPTDREARLQLAQLSEWSGDPYAATTHWQKVNESKADINSLDELIRLAEMTLQPAVAVDALQQRIAIVRPGDDDLKKLIKLYELDGRPAAAAAAVEKVIQQYGPTGVRYTLLADLHKKHSDYDQSLTAWQRHDEALKRTDESLLNQIELHWRLSQLDQAANLSRQLSGDSLPDVVSPYQLKLLAELAWRYKRPDLALMSGSRLELVENDADNMEIGRRVVQVLQDFGKYNDAVSKAERLWADTANTEFALTAMDIRFRRGDKQYPDNYLKTSSQTAPLHQTTEYWNYLASMHLRNKKVGDAELAYRQSLSIDSNNSSALSGLLWMYIGNSDEQKIQQILRNHHERAQNLPELWSAFAIASLQIGEAQNSLLWFARLGDRIDVDYSLLLLYADALELVEQAGKAQRLRRYTLQKLRPFLTDESAQEHSVLVRQYSRLLSRYGSAEEQERFNRYLLGQESNSLDNAGFWQEDTAIAWLMSTERHEYARVIMSRIHQSRLETPAWQQMALALKSKDQQAVQSVLNLGGPVSAGNRILALRTLGQDRQAQQLAVKLNRKATTLSERQLASQQYTSIRASRPSFAGSSFNSFSVSGLSVNEVGVSARHTFSLSDMGVSVDYVQRSLDSSRFDLNGMKEQSEVAVSLHYAKGQQGGRLTTGFVSALDSDFSYVDGLYYRTSRDGKLRVTGEVAYSEAATYSTELRIAGKQNRATIGVENSFGKNRFFRLQVDATEIKTRVSDESVARGTLARGEIGFRGSIGSTVWTTSLVGDTINNDRVAVLPDELKLRPTATMDSVLAEEATSLSFNASLARGEVNGTFPQTSSPRYYINTRLGHTWPDYTFGLQVDVGAGMRLLGGDEISLDLSHEVLSTRPAPGESDSTSFGLNYRYHF